MFVVKAVFICALFVLANCDTRIRYRFFNDGLAVADYNVTNFHQILLHPNFVQNRLTVMFHYSEEQTLTTPQVVDVMTSYAMNSNFNFIIVHYDSAATITTGNANGLASGITQSLLNIFDSGYNSGLTSLIGFGLGAQIMARASRNVQSNSNRRHVIGRLTGLDPLDLGLITLLGRLSSADAQWVESVHTEGNNFGDLNSRGHIAFFVNGGVTQPMCGQSSSRDRERCSHAYALTYWAESVRSPVPIFPALQCNSWSEFMVGQCNGNFESFMGRANWAANLRGTYFLQTNMIPPYTRNMAAPF